ncbi:asparagine synthetase B family protein [Fusobacterium ulcerans]|uniref:hypothetical protein n=1 Tax=Fusobacterium ulcerans TaxID=861 RepID=UPI001D0AE365|nr:hypothetical protein [Fusobacterium ulcerans]MCB8566256.1 hypothetical protein [Fusobacterium ulcerans]MCB8650248.1 hypothetical protein [Fusobacterium ulcerans]
MKNGFYGEFYFNKEEIKNIFYLEEKKYKDKSISVNMIDNGKFLKDKLFFKDEDEIFLLNGVILNNHELKKKLKISSWQEAFLYLYKQKGLNFLNEFRGTFNGLIYNIKTKELVLFTDQIKSKDIFYSMDNEKISFSTELNELALKNKIENELDIDAAYLLLTFGGTLEERTLFKKIRKLNYGTCLKINNKEIKKINYYTLKIQENNSLTLSSAIENIDILFKTAIKREYEKEREYNYNHLIGLSAGRDSRMNIFVSRKIGYLENRLLYTFSENDSLDEKIPKKISNDLKEEWIFKSLNNGNFIKELEEVVKISSGEREVGGMLHGRSLLKYLELKKFGINHNGMIGDAVLSTFGKNKKIKKIEDIKYMYSRKLCNKVQEKKIIHFERYETEEIFNYINRAYHITNASSIMFADEIEFVSPFLDIDFLEFCLSIPYEIRKGNKLYDTWILRKYPEAAKYSHNGRRIGGYEINILDKSISFDKIRRKGIKFLLKKTIFRSQNEKSKDGMNPFDKWYDNNNEVKVFIKNYFKKNIFLLEKYSELKKDAEYLFDIGNTIEKLQVLNLLATLKFFFNK